VASELLAEVTEASVVCRGKELGGRCSAWLLTAARLFAASARGSGEHACREAQDRQRDAA
jgi:hypothetical protein